MSGMVSTIREGLLYSTVVFSGKERIRERIDQDNRRVAVIWSVVEIAFWLFCLFLSINDPAFELCRPLYFSVLALAIVTLVLAAIIAPKSPRIIRPLVVAMQVILLGAGIGLAFFQWDVRSATFIAAVLIVPVMFVVDTLPTLALEALGIVFFMVFGSSYVMPDVYSWTYKSLIIFSIAGILIGHIINKARFERYAFEDSALELAELRHRFAYYDQLTGLQNRRAYTERVERLQASMPAACCIVSADINGLKQANDTYGHSAGDELLIGAATCLRSCFEGIGEVYRLGGDEFCIIAMETEEDVAKRLLQLEQMAASWKGQHVDGISISYGVAAAQESPDFDAVLREADRKMYEYKRNYYLTSGRDRRQRQDTPPVVRTDPAMGFAV